MPNTNYSFATVAGQTIAFDAATDILSFGAGYSAAQLVLTVSGSNLIVTIGGQSVTLTGMSLEKLRLAALAFADGSIAQIGDGLATTSLDSGKNTTTGGDGNDYLSGLGGDDVLSGGKGNDTILVGSGSDTVNGGEGDDTVVIDNELQAADRIDGGAGFDEVRLSGNYSNLSFVDGTIKNVERLLLAGDNNPAATRTYKLTMHDATVADGATLQVDGSALDAADKLEFDGSAELSGAFALTGGAGADILKGGAGADVIVGGAGNDTITGGLGADLLTGGAGEDIFSFARGAAKSDSSPTTIDRITDFEGAGAIGGDRIQLPVPNGGKPLAWAGFKPFVLGPGQQAPNPGDGYADVFYDHSGGKTRIVIDVNDDGLISEVDQIILLDGVHNLQPEDFDAAFSVIRGTDNPDDILGSAYGETIDAKAGDDVVDGLGGNDVLQGGAGEDTLYGSAGDDDIYGGTENDDLYGGDNTDELYGGAGADALHGDAGNDTIKGEAGDDLVEGGIGGDTIDGGAGEDELYGGADGDGIKGGIENDALYGDAGNDTLEGDAGNDTLYGGTENDTLKGGQGTDHLYGGQGNDTLYGDEGSTADGVIDYIDGGDGDDTLYAGTGRDVLTGGAGADKFIATNGTSSAAYPNRITDFVVADGDKLKLEISGNKPLAWYGYKPFFFDGTFGNSGVQFPLAQDGLADAIWDYDAATDTTRVAVDVDDDGVFSTGDLLIYLTGQHNLSASTFYETFAVVRGGAGDDVMPGTVNADTYYGMGGQDTINGEAGGDTLYGGDGDDTIDGGTQGDTLYGDVGDDTLYGGAGNFADTVYGGVGHDELRGGEGNDVLYGGADDDIFYGDTGDDDVYGGTGLDTLYGGEGADDLRGGDDQDLLDGGVGNDDLEGDAGNDTLYGGTGNDTLEGGAGVDHLYGGENNDTLYGNDGADFVEGADGDDTVYGGGGDTISTGTGADKLYFYYNTNLSALGALARITDYQTGSDRLDISGYWGTAKTFVFNGGDRQLGALVASGPNQTILGNGGDGLADVLYTTTADGLTTYLIVDVNDDGKLDAEDVVIAFDGDLDFTTADFTPGMFKVMRGTDGADVMEGTEQIDTVYGVGGNDQITTYGGNDIAYGQAGDDTIDGGLGEDTLYGGENNDTLYGGAGATKDYLYGGDGNDTIEGGEGGDTATGDNGEDTLFGGLGDDTLNGNAGNDVIYGGDGNDTLDGGTENDTIEGGIGNDTISGGNGNDTLEGGDNNDTISGGEGTNTIDGEDGNDTLTGGSGVDTMNGGAGTDTITVGAADLVTGGADADRIKAYFNSNTSVFAAQGRVTDFQNGVDTLELLGANGATLKFVFNQGDRQLGALVASGPNQTILGNGGDGLADVLFTTSADGQTTHLILDVNDDGKLDAADLVLAFDGDIDFTEASFIANTFAVKRGTAGADILDGTAGVDTIYGVGGNDTISGFEGNDDLFGQGGDDTIYGGLGEDEIEGGDDNDTLDGGEGNFRDWIYGGAGNDSMTGGEASDFLYGGTGTDSAYGGLGDDTLDGGAGEDTLEGGEGNDTMRGGSENDTAFGGLGNDGIDGDAGNDILHGEEHNDDLKGGTGEDKLYGGDGNDTLDGGGQVDELFGGEGDDTIWFARGDLVTGGAGADKFKTYYNSDASVLAGAARILDFQQGIDKLELTAANGGYKLLAFNPQPIAPGLGLNGAIQFAGDAFADIVYAHETGPNGPVTRVFVDLNDNGKLDADDAVFELAGHITLTVDDFTPATFSAIRGTPDGDMLTGTGAADDIYGVAGNDTISGGEGADDLYGQDGDDTLYGDGNGDGLYGGLGSDKGYGGTGDDTLWGHQGDDTLEGGEGNDTLHGGTENDTLRGGFGNDTLNGNEGADTLEGGADNDTLNGGDGADILLGQDGVDTLKGDAGNDTIQGGALNDTITGGAGDDTIDGGTEIDTAVFGGKVAEYEITADNGKIIVKHIKPGGTDGTDTLTNVEKLEFSDGTVQGSFLTVSDGVVVEGDNGQKMMAFTVSLFGNPGGAVTVNYATTNGTATAGSDYVAKTGSLSFGVGETVKTVLVPVNGDTTNEVDETFNLTLNNANGAAIVDGVGVGTILNDDVSVSIADAQIVEGNGGTKTLEFVLTLDKPAVGIVSVGYKTSGVTATEGTDYVAASGFAQFAAGQQSIKISVTINGDIAAELDESFIVELLSATGGKIGDGVAVGTILNDDLNHAPNAVGDAFTVEYETALETTPEALLANDSDSDGQPLSLVSVQGAVNGSVAIVDGKVVFTPAAGYSGPASFTYTISDGTGGTATATVNVTVEAPPPPPNSAPVGVADSYAIAEDGVLSVNAQNGVLANDTDVDGDALIAILHQGPAHGTLTLNPDGSFVYRPAANYNGPDSFSYVANDGTENGEVVTVTLNVTPVNDAPTAVANSYTIAEDGTLTVGAANGVLANDSDVDGNALTAQLVNGPQHGTLTLNPDGSFVYTPANNYAGPDSFTYRANDGSANSAPVTVTLSVTPVNDAPNAVANVYTVAEDGTLNVTAGNGVLANDSDPEGNAMTAELVDGPAHGTLTLNANGSFTYVPDANWNGPDSFTYRATDGNAASAPVTVTLNVTPVNDAPVAQANAYAIGEDGTLTVNAANGVLANDSDVDGNVLTAQLVTGPQHGTLTLNANGSFTYVPAANYNGPDSFTYRANDGSSNSAPVTVTLNVTPVNDAPDAVNDSVSTGFNTPVSVPVAALLANDSDADGNPLSVVSVQGAVNGTVALVDGVVTFTPTAGFSGNASYTYTVSDGQGGTDTATVQVVVGGQPNRAPTGSADSYAVNEDQSLSVSAANGVLKNDSDPDGNPITAQLVTGPAHGTLVLNANGSFTYTPAANYNGADSFTYRVSDGTTTSEPVTVTLGVNPVNDAPVAAANNYAVQEDGTLTVNAANGVLANDSDVDGNALTAQLVTGPQHGTLTFNADGSFVYKPAANYNGADSFTYRANDGSANSTPVTVTLNVTAVNDAPDAVNDGPLATAHNTPLVTSAATLLANDSDVDGNPPVIVSVQDAVNGTVSLNNGVVTFTPAAGFSGTASYSYTVSDGLGLFDTATVTVQVGAPASSTPVGVADSYAATEDKTLTVTAANGVLKNDSDPDGGTLSVQLVSGPANGTLTLNADGSFVYKGAQHFNGVDSFTYRVSDGTNVSEPVTVTLTVSAVNDAPVAKADTYVVAEDGVLNVTGKGVLANDIDPDSNLTAELVAGPAHGTLTLNADGSFSYVPAANWSGVDSFTYRANDGQVVSAPVTVTLRVNPVNDAPASQADAYAVENGPLVVNAANGVLANDSDVEGSTLTAQLVTGPQHGTLTFNANGSFTYVPANGYSGADSFTYRAHDGSAYGAPVTVTLNVQSANVPPVSAADAYGVNEDGTLTVSAANGVLANDSDANGNALTAELVAGPQHGTLTLNPDGSFTYVPAANYNGPDSFTYRANDGSAYGTPVTVTLNVAAVNDAPAATGDAYAIGEDGVLTVDAANGVLANDSDADGNALTAQLVEGPQHGTLTLNPDGSFTYTPAENYNGPDSFTYVASDGSTTSAPVTVTLNVAPVNDWPDATDDGGFETGFESPLVISADALLSNDSDADGDTLVILSVQDAQNGTVSMVGNEIIFVPEPGYWGSAQFTYTVADRQGGQVTVNVSLQIAPPPADDELFYSTAADEAFDGGAGIDTVSYAGVAGGVLVTLAKDTAQNTGAGGFDTLSGIENLEGSAFADNLSGDAGDNRLDGGDGADVLKGGDGNDLLDGGTGTDTMEGGNGDDTYVVDSAGDVVKDISGSADKVLTGLAAYTLATGIEQLVFSGAGSFAGTGNNIANVITGGAGSDLLDGKQGADTLIGLGGDDTYAVDNAGDQVIEAAGGGDDTVIASASYALTAGSEIERLRAIAGSAAIALTGNERNDHLIGNDGANRLDGGAGADTLEGGLGSDTYVVDDAGDVVIEGANAGTDTVISAIDWTLGANLENLTLTGAGGLTGTGNELANRITGSDGGDVIAARGGNDTVVAGAGADTVQGEDGNDTIEGGDGADTLHGDAGDDRLYGGADADMLWGGLGNDQLDGGAGADTLDGMDGSDRLVGGEGDDILDGGAAGDTLTGGAGDDAMTGGAGADRFVFVDLADFGTGNDHIADFVRLEGDRIDLAAVDADANTAGDQGFVFIGAGAFTGVAGQLRYEMVGDTAIVSGDVNGDGIADFSFQVSGSGALVGGDFLP